MNSVLYELTKSVLVHINAARLAMMDFTLNHGRIGSGLNLETSYTIVVDIILLKVALKKDIKH